MKKTILILFTFLIAGLLVDCKKKKANDIEEEGTSFDKSGMLSNYADNLVIPNIVSAKNALDSFALSYNAFIQNKTVGNLITARQKFKRAYHQYQYIALFEFGPSETELVRTNFNTYPTDSSQINSNISTGVYNLGTVANTDAKGFPTIDYLLYGKNVPDASIVALFDTDTKAANRHAYMNACLGEMQLKLTTIINGWNAGYKGTFTSNTGSEIGSSLGMLVNQLNYEVDLIKNAKVGIPLGKKSLGVALPEKCEAYYDNTMSVSLIKACLANIENAYLGRSMSGSDGLGLDDYLDALKVQHNSGTLNNAIKNQFSVLRSKLNLVNEPLSVSVVNDFATVDAAYVEMVKLLVLLKTDMPSAMGIVITYQDGDGD